jgi:transcriptional regulator with XRE-family HTH domain
VNGLAQRLKEARKQSGLSQEKLAEAVGVSGHAVYLFERGKNRPALDTLERIAAATGKPLPWFFGADAAPEPAAPSGTQAAAPSPAPPRRTHRRTRRPCWRSSCRLRSRPTNGPTSGTAR